MRSAADLTDDDIRFLTERHLGTLTTLRADGSPHVVAIAFTHLDGVVTILTNDGSTKVRNVERGSRAVVCQVDGRRWLTLEGEATVWRDPESMEPAIRRHAERFRSVSDNPHRVVIAIDVDRVMGRA